jgi:hypothetical protein
LLLLRAEASAIRLPPLICRLDSRRMKALTLIVSSGVANQVSLPKYSFSLNVAGKLPL